MHFTTQNPARMVSAPTEGAMCGALGIFGHGAKSLPRYPLRGRVSVAACDHSEIVDIWARSALPSSHRRVLPMSTTNTLPAASAHDVTDRSLGTLFVCLSEPGKGCRRSAHVQTFEACPNL